MKILRWGILGTANIARTVIPAIRRSPGNEVVAVASRTLLRAQEFARELGIRQAYGDYGALLEAGGVDAIYVPLPNSLHAQWTVRALEAGCPVLCEKPLALHGAQAREVAAAAARTGLPVAEAFMFRFHPLYDRLLELIAGGAIGSLAGLASSFCFMDDMSGIVASQELGGGALMDVGCYCVSFSRLVAGCEPVRVSGLAVGEGVDRSFAGVLEFHGGLLAQLEASIASGERHFAAAHGTSGSILVPSPWLPGTGPTELRLVRFGQPDEVIPVAGADSYRLEIDDFARAVRTGCPPRWPVADAVANMEAIDRLFAAAASHKGPPQNKSIDTEVGDAPCPQGVGVHAGRRRT